MDNRARVAIRQCYYSVPARYAGRRLPVRLSATMIEVLDGPAMSWRGTNVRPARYVEVLTLDHYLEVLQRKPGALPGATALAQAKAERCVHRDAPAPTGTPPARPPATPQGPGR